MSNLRQIYKMLDTAVDRVEIEGLLNRKESIITARVSLLLFAIMFILLTLRLW